MSFERRGEAVVAAHSVDELRLIYRVLHRHLAAHPELMDTHFLIELQNFLHDQARLEGVDTADHGAWDAWLGNSTDATCEARVRQRRTIRPDDHD
ncbi:MAG: hypothetical protein ACE5GE_11555 [Phycisphaerae bacterium]